MRRAALLAARRISHGAGVDVVLLTTSTKDNQPIEMAALLVRDRGRVVCLGNTEINLDWRLWFSKEIEFLFSRSTGAGIYDPDYFTRVTTIPLAMCAGRRSETWSPFWTCSPKTGSTHQI